VSGVGPNREVGLKINFLILGFIERILRKVRVAVLHLVGGEFGGVENDGGRVFIRLSCCQS